MASKLSAPGPCVGAAPLALLCAELQHVASGLCGARGGLAGRPPRRGPANDGDPRGHEVRSWPLAAALDALPSDAMRHKDFRTTILQSKLYEAKFHKAAAAAAATNDSTKPARRGAWD